MIFHPDVCVDPDAEKKFKEIQKAYETLSNPLKRAQYDRIENSYKEYPASWPTRQEA